MATPNDLGPGYFDEDQEPVDTMEGYDQGGQAEETPLPTFEQQNYEVQQMMRPEVQPAPPTWPEDDTKLTIDQRLEMASYYRQLYQERLFNNTAPAAFAVEKRIQSFIRGELESLMGVAPRLAANNQFDREDVIILKALAKKLLDQQRQTPSSERKKSQAPARRAPAAPPAQQSPPPAPAPTRPSVRKAPAPPDAAPSPPPQAPRQRPPVPRAQVPTIVTAKDNTPVYDPKTQEPPLDVVYRDPEGRLHKDVIENGERVMKNLDVQAKPFHTTPLPMPSFEGMAMLAMREIDAKTRGRNRTEQLYIAEQTGRR